MPRPAKPAAESLIPVVVQDVRTNNVLMLAWANREALALTRRTGEMHYWSRSRGRLWRKGETSGHVQRVVSLHWDCDRDALLARVEQTGPACHRNTYTCFSAREFPTPSMLQELWDVFAERKRHPEEGSYVCKLLQPGDKALQKVGEEAVEFILAAKGKDRKAAIGEAADLFFHATLALFKRGITLAEVASELDERKGKRRPAGSKTAVPVRRPAARRRK